MTQLYRYEVFVELGSDQEAMDLINYIHAAVCGGEVVDGEHKCGPRFWQANVAGYRGIHPVEEATEIMPQAVADAVFPDLNEVVAAHGQDAT